jgi:hypothetical protein
VLLADPALLVAISRTLKRCPALPLTGV